LFSIIREVPQNYNNYFRASRETEYVDWKKAKRVTLAKLKPSVKDNLSPSPGVDARGAQIVSEQARCAVSVAGESLSLRSHRGGTDRQDGGNDQLARRTTIRSTLLPAIDRISTFL
jgi:hypothetical protein